MSTLTSPPGTVALDTPIRDGARHAGDSTHPWRFRARYSVLMGVGALVLAVWITALAATLPTHHTADGWSVTWVGFDCAELVAFVVTAWSAWRGRQLTMPASLVTATLLLCDAWFDVALSWHNLRAGFKHRHRSIRGSAVSSLALAQFIRRGPTDRSQRAQPARRADADLPGTRHSAVQSRRTDPRSSGPARLVRYLA
jgi:hypothetical protein